ncbi:hypothetical protein [Actinophytocola sediminis]
MGGRVWSWFLEFAPVREAVRRQVRAAVDQVMDDTEHALARQRERHQAALGDGAGQVTELRARVDDLMTTNAELLTTTATLRTELTEAAEATERETAAREEFAHRLVREQEAAAVAQWHGATTDVFCCQSCWAFWFLSTTPDRTSCVVRGPFGRHDAACAVCADPLVVLPAAKSVVYRKGAEDRVCRPVEDDGVRSEIALAGAELDAIADGLTRLPKVPSRTTAWVATGLTGMPELPAKVLGEIAARTTMAVPLDGIVAGIRAFIEVRAPRQPS